MFRFNFSQVHWFHLLLVINGIAPSFSETGCDESAIEQCSNVLQMVLKNPNLAFPNKEDQIEVACGYYNQYVECIIQLADRCFKSYSKDAFLGTFSGMIDLVSEFCAPGSPYRQEFLKHSSCYQSIDKKLISCVDEYSAEAEALKTAKLSDEERIKRSCCYMNSSTECLVAPTEKKCGPGAVDLLKRSFEKAYGPLTMICSGLKYDSASCFSAASSITSSGLLFLILVIIMSLKH